MHELYMLDRVRIWRYVSLICFHQLLCCVVLGYQLLNLLRNDKLDHDVAWGCQRQQTGLAEIHTNLNIYSSSGPKKLSFQLLFIQTCSKILRSLSLAFFRDASVAGNGFLHGFTTTEPTFVKTKPCFRHVSVYTGPPGGLLVWHFKEFLALSVLLVGEKLLFLVCSDI